MSMAPCTNSHLDNALYSAIAIGCFSAMAMLASKASADLQQMDPRTAMPVTV